VMRLKEGGFVRNSLQHDTLRNGPRAFAYALASYAWAVVEGKDVNIEEVANGLAMVFMVGLHGTSAAVMVLISRRLYSCKLKDIYLRL
jgi:hypothetical protein